MLTADSSALADSLKKAEQEIQRRLIGMVNKFARDFVEGAVSKTPIGDSQKFASYYQARTTLPQVEGLSRGNWQIKHTPDFQTLLIAGQASGEAAADQSELYMQANYKLGDTFYVGNATPYIQALENNSSVQTDRQGISGPTIDLVTRVYQQRLDDYYKQS